MWAHFPVVPAPLVGLLCSLAYLRWAPLKGQRGRTFVSSNKYDLRLDHELDGQKEFVFMGSVRIGGGDTEVDV